jgi:guanyl-specific ribonuclease Sa
VEGNAVNRTDPSGLQPPSDQFVTMCRSVAQSIPGIYDDSLCFAAAALAALAALGTISVASAAASALLDNSSSYARAPFANISNQGYMSDYERSIWLANSGRDPERGAPGIGTDEPRLPTGPLPRITWQDIATFPVASEQATETEPAPRRDPTPSSYPIPLPTNTCTPTPTPTPDCSSRLRGGVFPYIPPISEHELVTCRPEVAPTLALIRSNGPFPVYPQSGCRLGLCDHRDYYNTSGYLPPPSDPSRRTATGYLEYTVPPGISPRGTKRIVTMGSLPRESSAFQSMYYTEFHYSSFVQVV